MLYFVVGGVQLLIVNNVENLNGCLFLVDGGYNIEEGIEYFFYWDMKMWNWDFIQFVV